MVTADISLPSVTGSASSYEGLKLQTMIYDAHYVTAFSKLL